MRHGVPITPRGKGTGNYGQAIPFDGGLVLDTSRAREILEVGDGFITAEAGATMVAIETTANKAGQQVLMYPSTANSTIGGFVSGGSGGTGSIKHGMLHTGFVLALDVVHAVPDARAHPRRGRGHRALHPQLRHRRDHRPGDGQTRTPAGLARVLRELRRLRAGASA